MAAAIAEILIRAGALATVLAARGMAVVASVTAIMITVQCARLGAMELVMITALPIVAEVLIIILAALTNMLYC